MGSSTSVITENPQPPCGRGEAYAKEIPAASTGNNIEGTYSGERRSWGPWPSEVPPTGVLTGVLGEMAFYYGACWLHHRCSDQRRGKMS